jgi:hypothetical protein
MASRDLGTLSRLVHAILADSNAIERIETLANYGQKFWPKITGRFPACPIFGCGSAPPTPIAVSDPAQRQLSAKT